MLSAGSSVRKVEGGLTVVEVRHGLQDVAAGVERPVFANGARRVPPCEQDIFVSANFPEALNASCNGSVSWSVALAFVDEGICTP